MATSTGKSRGAGRGSIDIVRVYDAREGEGVPKGATCFLVDRLWPRGVSKDSLDLAGWPKELTPSSDLRKEFHGEGIDWEHFAESYRAELDGRREDGETDEAVSEIREALDAGDVVLLIAGKDVEHTHAAVLREWLLDEL